MNNLEFIDINNVQCLVVYKDFFKTLGIEQPPKLRRSPSLYFLLDVDTLIDDIREQFTSKYIPAILGSREPILPVRTTCE